MYLWRHFERTETLRRQATPDEWCPNSLAIATTVSVFAGLVQFLGLIRWTFLVPYLAKTYFEPDSSQATRESIAVVFQAFHRFAGMASGEHLGYLYTSVWTALIAFAITQSSQFNCWLGWAGFIPAIGILIGLFEESGFKAAAAINTISYIPWSVWLISVGVAFLLYWGVKRSGLAPPNSQKVKNS